MAILEILTYPNPELKKISQVVVDFDDTVAQFILDLEETLYVQPGCVGIAAPQVGNLQRILLIDSSRNPRFPSRHGKAALINPTILFAEGSVVGREGCLSLPDFTGNVTRAQKIVVEAQNITGAKFQLEAENFEARLILHEIDHLDGILFLDRVSSLKTDVFRRKPVKALKPSEQNLA